VQKASIFFISEKTPFRIAVKTAYHPQIDAVYVQLMLAYTLVIIGVVALYKNRNDR
jgi:hypothetical protein